MVLPLIPLAATLIPLVAEVAPSVVRFLVGDKAAQSAERVAETTKTVTEAATKVAGVIQSVTQVDVSTPEGVAEVRKRLEQDAALKSQLQIELSRLDLDMERVELEREQAFLADRRNAREMAVERRRVGGGDIRANIMLLAAFVAVVAIVAMLIIVPGIPDAVLGFVIGIGGMFARNIGSAFDYEFGSSRGSRTKDELLTIRELDDGRLREVETMTAMSKVADTARAVAAAGSAAEKLRTLIKAS